jgi:hypothetical protein
MTKTTPCTVEIGPHIIRKRKILGRLGHEKKAAHLVRPQTLSHPTPNRAPSSPPVPEFLLPMIAVENGYFRDHGLDATIRIIPGGQSMPAALQSDSLQIAALSTASLIQVTDSGLDLIIVSGGPSRR